MGISSPDRRGGHPRRRADTRRSRAAPAARIHAGSCVSVLVMSTPHSSAACCACVFPGNSGSPSHASATVHPAAHTSAGAPYGLPSTCSGARYRSVVASSLWRASVELATLEKSHSTARRAAGSHSTLCGLTSRCTMPRACTAPSARSSCTASSHAAPSSIPGASASVPGKRSMTRYDTPWSSVHASSRRTQPGSPSSARSAAASARGHGTSSASLWSPHSA